MNQWRPGYGKRLPPLRLQGRWWAVCSDDSVHGWLLELTDDYRDECGNFIPPEQLVPVRDDEADEGVPS